MNSDIHLEHRASSSQGKHEGEPSLGLCDRLDRTRDNSQRQLPTDHDYAVPTREYQTDQSSLKTAPTAARSVFGKRKHKPPKQPIDLAQLTRSLHIRPKHSLTHKTVCSTTSHKRLSGLTFSAAQEPIVSLIERQRSNPFVATSGPGGTWNGSTEMRSYRTSSTVRVSVPLGA